MIKKIFYIIIAVLLVSSQIYAATQTMSACTQAAFNTAYSAASSGDTIAFPVGSCSITWSGTTTIAKTDLVILGRGVGTTILTNAKFSMTGDSANGLRVTAIEFNGPTSGTLFDFTVSGGRHEDIRIDNNEFDNIYNVTNFGVSESPNGAVPYNCVIDNNHYKGGASSYTQNYVWGDCNSTTEFPFTLGSLHGVYFEDNDIDDSGGDMDHFIASRCGSRYIVRYNDFDIVAWDPIDAHDSNEGGDRTNGIRGSWTTEIYENEFSYSTGSRRGIHLRGGQHVIYNNRLNINQSDSAIKLTSYNMIPPADCTYNECTTGTGVCSGGRWCDFINETYVWNNKYNCGSDMTDCTSGSVTTAIDYSYVVEDSDFYMSEASGYTALTYPHPLRNESQGDIKTIGVTSVGVNRGGS